jgi:hypothetical protein
MEPDCIKVDLDRVSHIQSRLKSKLMMILSGGSLESMGRRRM